MRLTLLTLTLILSTLNVVRAESEPVDYIAPEGMIYGGQFIDHILPVEPLGPLRTDVWGAEKVKPRDPLLGLEDATYSYWGGDIMYEDGKYHMFTCRWREDNEVGERSGHMTWSSSIVVYAVADNPIGPYTVVAEVGKGHNPEITKSKDGRYYVGGMGSVAYVSDAIGGPWKRIKPNYQWLRRQSTAPNKTYAIREDSSAIVMSQRGLFISEDASENHLIELVDTVVYRKIADNGAEDPVIWRDEVQYHCIYNGPRIRSKAFYMRSKDGVRWKLEQGVAYNGDVVRYTTGHQEGWYKLERPKVIQDQYGRATHIHFAALDTLKWCDLGNDIHSSKNIILPLRVPRRIEILNKERVNNQTRKIEVRILSEEGFNPAKELDIATLKFGAPECIDFGGGALSTRSKSEGEDLIVTFEGEGGFEEHNFTAKLLGYDRSGELIYGYAKMKPSQGDLQDEIMLHTITNHIELSGEMIFAVNYKTAGARALCLDFVDITSGEVVSSEVVKQVNGEDITIVHFHSPKPIDLKHRYRFDLYLARPNKKQVSTIDKVSKEVYVKDPNAPDEGVEIVSKNGSEITLDQVVTLSIKYVAHEQRDLMVTFIKSRPQWTPLGAIKKARVKGEGVVDIDISLSEFSDLYREGNLCTLQIYLSEVDGGEPGRITLHKAKWFDVVR